MSQPKYKRVADEITQRINDGVYAPKTILPDQKSLAKEFGVSRLTVKKALDGLERAGLIYKQSGLGTVVLGTIPIKSEQDAVADCFTGLQKQLGKENVTSKIIKFNVQFPDEELQKYLDIKANEPVYEIIRLRVYKGQPYVLEHTFMPIKLIPNLSEKILEDSIYTYIHKKLKLKFGGAYRKIKAVKADKYDIEYLEAKKDDPLLELEQIVWLNNGQTFEYSRSRNRYDTRNYVVLDTNNF